MIRKIELWDWECFEHALVEDLHEGLNLIFGESDSGKTSIVRALRLVAHNDFDPRSVRAGKKNCKVYVETERGWVKVTRGRDNVWETCRAGEPPEVFSKIGKNILPQAAEILGLHIVRLGDMELPVNIMDQGEGHFMLNELGGDSASGSMRAQIVDEISGLSGIEGLIKEVSLDRHRFGRAVKENEDRAAELRASMHDEAAIREEGDVLAEARSLVDLNDENGVIVEEMADLFERHNAAAEEAARLSSELASMPNTRVLDALLRKGRVAFARASAMRSVHELHGAEENGFAEAAAELARMPEPEAAALVLEAAEESLSRSRRMRLLADEHARMGEEVAAAERRLAGAPDPVAAGKALAVAADKMRRADEVRGAAYEIVAALEGLDDAEAALDDCRAELAAAEAECAEALAEVELCPLTGRPVTSECFEGMKFPVRRKT